MHCLTFKSEKVRREALLEPMIGTRAFIEETGKLEEWNGIEWVPSLVEDSKSNLPKIIEITNNLAKIIDRRAISRWWHTSNPKLSDQTPLEKLENGEVQVVVDLSQSYLDTSFS